MAEMVMPEERHKLPLGTVLQQRYQIQKVLGQGGFGITYLAWDHMQGESVAVKEFYPQSIVTRDCAWGLDVQCITQRHLANFQSSKNRFLREADALQRFRNVHSIVDIRDYFEANNTAYIVMEYLVGRDLKHFLGQRGTLSVDETLRILEPVFHALTVVHRAGLVHRDISPDNIMLDNQSGAKLLDFGAVRSVEDPSVDSPLSKSTEAILKHGFAPIEQYNTRGSLGPWTDEYALCATIYYCLTGKVPVQPSYRITEKVEPEWDLIPGLTDTQRAALKKGMAIAPSDRFPDVGRLYEALYHGTPVVQPVGDCTVPVNDGTGPVTPVVPPADQGESKKMKAVIAVLLSVILVVFLGIGGWLIYDAVSDGRGGGGGDGPLIDDGPTGSETQTDPPPPPPPPPETPDTDPEPKPEPETEPDNTAWVNNVLIQEPLNILLQNKPEEKEPGGGEIEDYTKCREKVRSVTFQDHLGGAPEHVYNLGADGSNRVIGWCEWNGGYADIYIAAEGGINGYDACRKLFTGCKSMTRVEFNGAFHTEGCFDMKWMFYGCNQLRELDVSSFDTSEVTIMQAMFRGCHNLTELDVSNFETSRVKNFAQMFTSCFRIEYLDLSNFDTSRAENMSSMFCACSVLRSVDVSSFDTSNVTTMEQMFNYCYELEDLSLSWDISSVKIYSLFMCDGKTINGRPWREFFT